VIILISYDNQREAVLVGYLAGILDGEGTIAITKTQPNRYANMRYAARITLGMACKEVIDLFSQRYGGAVRVERVPNRRPIYRWAKVGTQAVMDVLPELTPLLIEKKERAELLMEYCASIDTTRRRGPRGYVLPVSDEELAKREEFYQKMKELNAWRAPTTTNRDDT
jgi:hypothetical protein